MFLQIYLKSFDNLNLKSLILTTLKFKKIPCPLRRDKGSYRVDGIQYAQGTSEL